MGLLCDIMRGIELQFGNDTSSGKVIDVVHDCIGIGSAGILGVNAPCTVRIASDKELASGLVFLEYVGEFVPLFVCLLP